MNRIELEQAVLDIMFSDMELVFDLGRSEILRRVYEADDETLIKFLEERGVI